MRRALSIFRRSLATFFLWSFTPTTAFAAQDLGPHLAEAFQQKNWNEVVGTATEILRRNPGSAEARLRGAYGLIQKGYPNAALAMLRRMSPADWKSIPQDLKPMVEVVALFQKKVPIISLAARIDQLNENETSSGLRDEIRFAKGRALFEKGDLAGATALLTLVNKGSRYSGPASYLLGTILVGKGDLDGAHNAFAQVFESQVLQQSTEFWNDLGADTTSQFGTSLNIVFDHNALAKANSVGELSIMAIARVLYQKKDFHGAIAQYNKIPRTSPLFSRAKLETIWALLNLEQHQKAQEVALDLSSDVTHFESLEALPVHALILTDAGKSAEGRIAVGKFMDVYRQSKESLIKYRQFPNPESLPPYLKNDLKDDKRIEAIEAYQASLRTELSALNREDRMLFPAYGAIAVDLEPLLKQSRDYASSIVVDLIDRRLKDLERLYVQGRLIIAETYLDERERLRAQFKGVVADEATQDSHDQQLVALLLKAIEEVEQARATNSPRNLSLEFRQSELLWELSSASAFLQKNKEGTTGKEAYEKYRKQAVQIAKDLASNHPKFTKRAQAMFFVGFALMEVGEEKEGLDWLRRYVAEYPNHENTPNAYRILADVEFEANRYKPAEDLYKNILKFPGSPIIGYSLYKIGWCNYGMKNTAKALLGLEQAILWTRSLENTDHLLNLKREAGRDLISIYAEVGNHKRAYEYFERFLGGDDATKWLADLARELERNGLFEKSNDLYTQLLTLNPSPEDRLAFQTSAIHGAYQLRDWTTVFDRTRDLVGAYEVVLKPEQPADTPAFKAEKILNEIILAQHFELDQYAKPEDVERILKLDQLYLTAFGGWKHAQMPLYQYAHFLLKYKKVPQAAVAFRTHWEQFQTDLKEPLKEESLRNLVHAWNSVEQDKESDPDPTEVKKRVDEIVKYAGLYNELYASTKHARPIAFLRTVTLLKHKRNEEGLAESQKVFDGNPSDDFGNRAFKNLRVVYYELKDWKRVYEWASAMLARPELGKTPYLADLKTVREEALFLWADNTTENLQAADLYLKIAEDPAMLRLRPKALYNAFVRYKEMGKRPEALAVAIKLEQAAPQFPDLLAVSGVRAAYYQDAGDYEKALPLYATFLKSPPPGTTPETIDQVRMSTALIAENLGHVPAAQGLYQAVVASAKTGPLADDAKLGLQRIQENAKRQPASTKAPEFKKWDGLVKTMADLEKSPLAKAEALPAKIQGGAQKLEKAIRAFLEVSADPATPPFWAYESYCAVPFLYTYYQQGIRSLGDGQPDELKVELEKLAKPLNAKSREMADQCMTRTTEGFHDGPMYRKVLGRWGWARSEAVVKQAQKIQGLLGSYAPWLEPIPLSETEEQIVKAHLEQKESPDSWYSLARARLNGGKMGLAKLTFLNSLAKEPKSSRILNALAVMKQMDRADVATLNAVFKKAYEAGSSPAYANFALVHLNGGRFEIAVKALEEAEDGKAFNDRPEIVAALSDLRSLVKAAEAARQAEEEAAR